MGELVDRRQLGRRAEDPELSLAAAARGRGPGDGLVDEAEPREVVVDEEPEHAVVGAGELADPDGERHPARGRRCRLPLRGPVAGRRGRRRRGAASSSRSCVRTTAIGRPTRPATCSLPKPANVSTVHERGVDRAQHRRQRGLAGRDLAAGDPVALGGVGGDDAGGDEAERALRVGEPEAGTAVGGHRCAPARSPTSRRRPPARAAARRAARRRRRSPRGSRRGGRGAGSRTPGSPAGSGRPGRPAPRCPPSPTGVVASTSRSCQRAGRSEAREERPGRRRHRAPRSGPGRRPRRPGGPAAARTRRPAWPGEPGPARRAGTPGRSPGPGPRGPVGTERTDAGRRRPGRTPRSWCGEAVEGRGGDVDVSQAAARTRSAASVSSGISPLLSVSRRSSAASTSSTAERIVVAAPEVSSERPVDGARRAGRVDGRVVAVLGRDLVDRTERPPVDGRRVEAGDLELPLEPERHPRLRPGGDAHRVGVGTLDQREAAQLVGHRPRLEPARGHLRARSGARARSAAARR